ncbi:MAG: hypothetical protein CMO19_01795 [Thaumarchaeota archaeon]|nr:hypothetical protein [Nitrososphaerota archaeon]|tara:strand:- start:5408 stop:6406 length:999 start_codon:yes stop_codon:yes gene_type:complete
MESKLTAIAPHRISICGGGTDFPSFYNNHNGAVINFAITRFSKIRLRVLKNKYVVIASDVDEYFEGSKDELLKIKNSSMPLYMIMKKGIPSKISIKSDVPPGSGLGSSGTLAVNLVNAFHHIDNKKKIKPLELSEKAYKLEAEIFKKAIGKQDHMPAAFGGFNFIEYKKNKIVVTPFKNKISNALTENCLLFYLGMTRDADKILRRQEKRVQSNSDEMIDVLKTMNKLTRKMRNDLNDGNFKEVGNTLEIAWELKKKFTKGVSNKFIDKVHDLAIESGAYGAKITGAGGGGHFLVIADKSNHKNIIKNIHSTGCKRVLFDVSLKGAVVNYGK